MLLPTYPGGYTFKPASWYLMPQNHCPSTVSYLPVQLGPKPKINPIFFSGPDHRISYQIQTPKNPPWNVS